MSIERASVDAVHYVYIIKCADQSHYVGCTNNLENRIERHQKGQVKSTSYRLPITLKTHIAFDNKYSAYNFEKYLKSVNK